ncbi:MAG TPA: zinc-binding dehydrogenase, partial [Candidatus Melainabacteria bacterium]|nr:zinc-binding dehydrogenase [Candidatus Melainabacteria bacterium]
LRKRACIQGTTLRARPLEEKILAGKVLAGNIVPLLESGKLRPSIDQVFSLKDAAEAHRYLESNESFGKVILKVGE